MAKAEKICGFRDCDFEAPSRIFGCDMCDKHALEVLKIGSGMIEVIRRCPELLKELSQELQNDS